MRFEQLTNVHLLARAAQRNLGARDLLVRETVQRVAQLEDFHWVIEACRDQNSLHDPKGALPTQDCSTGL